MNDLVADQFLADQISSGPDDEKDVSSSAMHTSSIPVIQMVFEVR